MKTSSKNLEWLRMSEHDLSHTFNVIKELRSEGDCSADELRNAHARFTEATARYLQTRKVTL